MTCDTYQRCGEILLQLFIYGLSNGAVLALNAIGVTVVYGAIRTLNLAHGDVFALSSVLVVTLIRGLNITAELPPALLIAELIFVLGCVVLFGALLNVVIERVAFKPFRGRSRLAPLVATLGISFILYQAALLWRTILPSWIPGDHRSVPGLPEVPLEDRIPDLLPDFDLVRTLGWPLNVVFRFNDLFIVLMAFACAFGVTWFLYRSATGRAIRACAQNPELAQISGVNLDGTIQRAFAFGGALAGAAAFAFALYYTRPFGNHGAQSGLLAFTAAILGGVGNPIGALVSSLFLGVSASFSDYFLAAQWTPVLSQTLLIGLLVLRPTGIASEGQAEGAMANAERDALTLTASDLRRQWGSRLMWGAAALALILPAFLDLQLQILLTGIGIFVLLALALNLLLGLAGILDLGFAVSYGIGGYAAALLTDRWGPFGGLLPQPLDLGIVLMISALFGALFGALKGRLTLRLRSDYLAVVTLSLGLVARQVIVNLSDVTGGAGGIAALPPPHIFTQTLTHPTAHYYLILGFVILGALVSQRLIHSRIGRAWLASGEDETAAASSGVNVAGYKTLAIGVSSALAAVAGALYANVFAYVAPDMVAFHVSAMTLAMVILGGAGSAPGAIWGAVIIAGYDRMIIPRLGHLLALIQPRNISLGYAPDVRGASYFTFGLALFLTVFIRARRRNEITKPDTQSEY